MRAGKSFNITAAMVAAAFGLPATTMIRNDTVTIESLQDRLMELRDAANNIQAKADAEQRPLTEDEKCEIEGIFNTFTDTEKEIARRKQLGDINERMSASAGRRTDALDQGGSDGGAGGAASPTAAASPAAGVHASRAQEETSRRRGSVPAQPRDTGKWGFRSYSEYLNAVVRASAKGAVPDPRLIMNAPTTYGQEGVGADGGFAVPPDFRTAIVTKVLGEESLLGRTDQQTSSSNSITFPADETTPWDSTNGVQAYWESEAGQKTQSKPKLGEKLVKLNKLIALVPLTDELLEDAPAMAGYVNRKAPEKMTFKINDAIVNGTGAGQPLGILNSAGTVTVAAESGQAAATVRMENIVNMWTRMYGPARARAVWLMNGDAEGQLPYLKFIDQGSGNAVPVYLPPTGLSTSPFSTLYGRPIIVTEAMPALGSAGDIILADLSQYLSIVKGGGVRQDVSIHLFFDYDITSFRFVMRVGGQPWWNTAISRPNSQASRGFFIALGAR